MQRAAAAEEGEPPELEAWLAQADLAQYTAQVKEYGYHTLKVLQAATEADVVEMTEDPQVGMLKPHRRLFLETWKAFHAASGDRGSTDVLPLSQRTLANCNFNPMYAKTAVPTGPLEIGAALQNILREFCADETLDWHSQGQPFLKDLQAEAMLNSHELAKADQIPVAAQRMWTSTLTIAGREFCSIMNYAGRKDSLRFVEPLAVLSLSLIHI